MSFKKHAPCGGAKPPEVGLVPFEAARCLVFPEEKADEACINGWIFFDADCAPCAGSAKRAAGFLGRHGFVLVPLQTPGAAERLGVTLADLLTRMHLLTSDGRRFAGADAFVEITRRIVWMRPLAYVAGSRGVLSVLRRIYDWIAAHRYCFGGTCRVSRRSSAFDWLPLAILPTVIFVLRDLMAGWVFMWTMAFALYAGCKWLTYRKAVANGAAFSKGRALGYLFGWVGMKAEVFASTSGSGTHITRPSKSICSPPRLEWCRSLGRVVVGATLVWGVARMIHPSAPLLSGWVGMFGIILFLHFGTFQLLALAWHCAGVPVEPLMQAPLLATSLGDFWGARWNTGFHTLAHAFLFRPLQKAAQASRLPSRHATLTPAARDKREARPNLSFPAIALPVLGVFLISGLIHELVITLPAHGGYGLPTAYFLLQGLGLVLERSAVGRRFGLGAGLPGRLFTLVVAAAPAFWLFPPVFVRNVILPMLEAIGAL